MEIIKTVTQLQEKLAAYKGKAIGFVPTMGFLHEGHLSLVKTAKEENEIVVMSIFVNPLQFGPNEDFERYPRNTERDTELAQVHGVDILFIPTVEEMYPAPLGIEMKVTAGTNVLCGKSRPGHFDGVAVVLSKLFHMVQPRRAYFGLKDAQQYAIVQTLVTALHFPVQVIGLPTVRDGDGLAKSSRNVYLSEKERAEARVLYQSLQKAKKAINDGETDVNKVKQLIESMITSQTTGSVDYIEVLTYPSLQKTDQTNTQIIIAVAVQFQQARLIDNLILSDTGQELNRLN